MVDGEVAGAVELRAGSFGAAVPAEMEGADAGEADVEVAAAVLEKRVCLRIT